MQGRNWMALAMLAPGSRMTSAAATTPLPDRNTGEQREFQFSIDGQQVASELGFGAPAAVQPGIDRGIPVHLEPVRRDAGPVVGRAGEGDHAGRAPTRSRARSGATSATAASTRAIRSCGRVVPIDNQQLAVHAGRPDPARTGCTSSATMEYEREPRTSIWNTPYPRFNVELEGDETIKMGGVRLDYQISPQVRVMGKVSEGRRLRPFDPGNNSHPAATGIDRRDQPRGPRAADAGAEQSGGERDQGGVCAMDLPEREPHHLVEPLAGGQRRHDRIAAHHVHRLHDRRQHVLPAARRPGHLERARRLHVFVQRAGPPRPADRRRVPPLYRRREQLPGVHGPAERHQRAPLRPISRRSFRTPSTPTPGTWRRSPRWCGPTTSASETSRPTISGRSLAPGCRTTGRSPRT